MKKISLTILVFLIPFLTMAQIRLEINGNVDKKITYKIGSTSSTIAEGTSVTIKSIYNSKGAPEVQIYNNDKDILFSIFISQLSNITFKPSTVKQFWQVQALKSEVYNNITKNGNQYELRNELELEAIEYIDYTEKNNLIFNDSYLESYLYALAYKIYPSRIEDDKPGLINIKILKSTKPNAFIYANGTMFLTTSLLSKINSEEELIAIMAHEIAHFVLDHSIININKAEKRLKRAKFWAGLATGVAAAADISMAANNDNYTPGAITLGTSILAYNIASEVNERMGLKYSKKQQLEADKYATEFMKFVNIDHTALSSALLKIKNDEIPNSNYTLALSSNNESKSTTEERIQAIGKPTKEFMNLDYDKTISLVNTFNAETQLNMHHLQTCIDLINRNINADIATEDDYILLAKVTNLMYDNEAKNNEALLHINKAKSLNIAPTNDIFKQEAIILIRLKKYDEAKIALNKYLDSIKLFKEKVWALKMINKINKMKKME